MIVRDQGIVAPDGPQPETIDRCVGQLLYSAALAALQPKIALVVGGEGEPRERLVGYF